MRRRLGILTPIALILLVALLFWFRGHGTDVPAVPRGRHADPEVSQRSRRMRLEQR